jgi:signal peptidase I
MEPTLCGIRAEPADAPSWTDRMPLKLAKWAITGKWYREVRVAIPGVVGPPRMGGADRPASCFYDVGSRRYEVPKSAVLLVKPGQYAGRGDLLWAGYVVTGDHVFVDKMRWNFVRPRRGQVVVFGTDRIAGIGQDTHYIKRLIGLPTEKVAIRPPDVLINGQPLRQPEQIARIARRDPKYPQGYRLALAGPMDPALLTDPDRSIDLGTQGYFVLGDNTSNSKDGRYWGCVPQPEMVGPAFLVYWPFSRRWGTLR